MTKTKSKAADEAAAPVSVSLLCADLKPWAEQPRKHFDQEAVEKLAGLMKARGANPAWPLLVRPHPSGRGFEIADGERRWRAALLAEIPQLHCVVQTLSDAEMLELAMISSVHKKELSPLETANGFKRMLDERDGDGKPLHTVETIAAVLSLSPSTVQWKLTLTKLTGSPVAASLEAGEITESHAILIATIPGAATRAQVLEMVLRPTGCPAPMPVSELRRRIALDYMKELRGVRWDLDDAELVPVEMERGERVAGGACSGCPWNAASEGKRADRLCMSPECYRAKETALHARWVAAKAAEGKAALDAVENAKVFGANGVTLSVQTDYVDLDEKPEKADIGAKVDVLPTWGKLVRDTGVPIVIAMDAKGRERTLVKRELAVTAIEQADAEQPPEKQILEPVKKKPASPERHAADVLAQKTEREIEARIARAEHDAIVTAARLPIAKLTDAWLGMALTTLAYRIDEELLAQICIRRGWTATEDGTDTDFLLEKADELPQHEGVSLLTELLMATNADDTFVEDWAAALGVDLKKVRKTEGDAIKAEAKGAAKKKGVAAGVVWIGEKQHDEVSDFVWHTDGVCGMPDFADVLLGKEWSAGIKVAHAAKGWTYGFSVQRNGTADFIAEPCTNIGAHYQTRALAVTSALTAIRQVLERGLATDDVMELITGYIAKAAKGGK